MIMACTRALTDRQDSAAAFGASTRCHEQIRAILESFAGEEDKGELTERVAALRERMIERQDQLLTSASTLGEILVKPLEAGDEQLMRRFECGWLAHKGRPTTQRTESSAARGEMVVCGCILPCNR